MIALRQVRVRVRVAARVTAWVRVSVRVGMKNNDRSQTGSDFFFFLIMALN
jgi:hypothetical protein